MERKRFLDIDSAKGLAIILVVLGHIVARKYPLGNEWFKFIKHGLYFFHMPFFMYLSGFVYFYTLPKLEENVDYLKYINKKAYRLLVPFFLMGFIAIIGKFIIAPILYVDNPIKDFKSALLSLIWDTSKSNTIFIWYIFILFVFSIVSLFLYRFLKGKMLPIFLFSLIICFIPMPEYLYLNFFGLYYVFFILGGFAYLYKDNYFKLIESNKLLFFSAFLAIFSIFYKNIPTNFNFDFRIISFFIGIASIPFLHSVARIPKIQSSSILQILGKYTFPIYLFNVPIIGATKGVLLHFFNWNGTNFLIYLPILLLSGIIIPIILSKYFFSKIPTLKKIFI